MSNIGHQARFLSSLFEPSINIFTSVIRETRLRWKISFYSIWYVKQSSTKCFQFYSRKDVDLHGLTVLQRILYTVFQTFRLFLHVIRAVGAFLHLQISHERAKVLSPPISNLISETMQGGQMKGEFFMRNKHKKLCDSASEKAPVSLDKKRFNILVNSEI